MSSSLIVITKLIRAFSGFSRLKEGIPASDLNETRVRKPKRGYHMTNTTTNDVLEGFLFSNEGKNTPSLTNKLERQDYTHLLGGLPSSVRGSAFSRISDMYTDSSVDGLLRDLQGGKMMSMQEVIDDINTLIDERLSLKKEVFGDADKILMNMNNFLASKSEHLEVATEVTIKEKLLDIESFKLQEKINAFRDIAALKKELRDRTQLFKEKENNINIIDQLLG